MSKKKQYTLQLLASQNPLHTEVKKQLLIFQKWCQHCTHEFINQQDLSVHLMCKHAATAGNQSHSTEQSLCTSQNGKSLSTVSATISEEEIQHNEEEIQHVEISEPPVERCCGRDVRKSITNRFKAKAIAAVEKGEKHIDVAERLNVNMSQISKWLKMKDKIVRTDVGENKKPFKIKPAEKYHELYRALKLKFLDARSNGQRVDFNWLWSKARLIFREQQNNEDSIVKKQVDVNFIKRSHLSYVKHS